jgi:hypothetical protein
MSSRSLRRVLAGFLVTAFLSLDNPVLVLAWEWLTDRLSPVEVAPAAERGSDAGWMLDPDG